LRGANVLASTDQGKTWHRRGRVSFPRPDFDEHSFIELKDGTLWMTARTKNGIWESYSKDKGMTWSAPQKSPIENINARHFIRRLESGHILLVKNGMHIDQRPHTRSELTAFISTDEGKTWQGGLVLDERRGVSYPDGFEDENGMIYISYDHDRSTEGEVLMARFREKDVLEKKFMTRKSGTKMLISKPLGLDRLPPPSEAFYQGQSK
jgi:predicted neuraminidase